MLSIKVLNVLRSLLVILTQFYARQLDRIVDAAITYTEVKREQKDNAAGYAKRLIEDAKAAGERLKVVAAQELQDAKDHEAAVIKQVQSLRL